MEACSFLPVVFICRWKSLQLTQILMKCCLPPQDSVLLIFLILISGINSPLLFSNIFLTVQVLHKFSWCNSSQFYSYLSLTEPGIRLLIRGLLETGVCLIIEISSFYWSQLNRFYFASSTWGWRQSQSPGSSLLTSKLVAEWLTAASLFWRWIQTLKEAYMQTKALLIWHKICTFTHLQDILDPWTVVIFSSMSANFPVASQ
jgi:hypothetical protein